MMGRRALMCMAGLAIFLPLWAADWAETLTQGRRLQIRWEETAERGLVAERIAAWLASLGEQAPEAVVFQAGALFEAVSQRKADLPPDRFFMVLNNYAVFLIRQNQNAEAVKRFAEAYKDQKLEELMAPEDAARCYFNFGVALARIDDVRRALNWHRKAFEIAPEFAPARRDLFRVAVSAQTVEALQPAFLTANDLLARGAIREVGDFLETCLRRFVEPEALWDAGFFEVFASYLATAAPSPARFVRRWRPRLRAAWEKSGGDFGQGAALRFILGLYDGSLTGESLQWRNASSLAEQSGIFMDSLGAQLAHAAGRGFESAGDPKTALQLWDLAWRLDPENLDRASRYIAALAVHGDRVEDAAAMMEASLARLLDANGAIQLAGAPEAKVRLHGMMGQWFADRGQWGRTGRIRGAAFHWKRAVDLLPATAKPDQPPRPAPTLLRNLGTAWAQLGKDKRAWQCYSRAAEALVALQRPEQARLVIKERDALEYQPRRKLRAVDQTLKANLVAEYQARIFGSERADVTLPADWLNAPQTEGALVLMSRVDEEKKRRFGEIYAELASSHETALVQPDNELARWIKSAGAGENLSRANFAGLDFSEYQFQRTDFRGVDLAGANLSSAVLTGANLAGANLTNANLDGANLRGANLDGALMKGVDLTKLAVPLTPQQLEQIRR